MTGKTKEKQGERMMTTFTKNKKTGKFDVLGFPTDVQAGRNVTVTKRDGTTTTVSVERVTKPFVAKWGELAGREVVIGTVKRRGYTRAKRDSRGYVTDRGHYDGYCGYPCPVSGRKCSPANGPCHDCQ
jgi:hypothetical protein